jgi:hypothetical protein
MSQTRYRRAALALALLSVLGSVALTPAAQASVPSAVVWHLEQQIQQTRQEARHWDSVVHAWHRRLRRTTGHLRRVLSELGVPRRRTDDLTGAPKAHRWLGPQRRLASALAALHDASQRDARDGALANRRRVRRRLLALQRTRSTILRALDGAGVDPNVHGPLTYGRWARALLASLGAPPCASDLQVVVAWEVAESTPASFNPLATGYWLPGAWTIGASHVDNYPSLAEGLQATRANLLMGPDAINYAVVVNDLIDCAPAAVTASAIRASYWCHGCAGGEYVTGQLPDVLADWQGFSSRLVSGG